MARVLQIGWPCEGFGPGSLVVAVGSASLRHTHVAYRPFGRTEDTYRIPGESPIVYRRRFVAVLASGLGAGCTSFGGSDEEGERTPTPTAAASSTPDPTPPATSVGATRPDSEPATVPREYQCESESRDRLWTGYQDVAWGDAEGFALRVNALAFEYGERATIELRNVSDETLHTGNEHKFNLELSTDDGWREVRVPTTDRALPYTDEAIVHEPGEGFEWEIELTESGIEAASYHEDDLTVCPDLPAGRYRFVYWGVLGESSLAVAFDLDRPESG